MMSRHTLLLSIGLAFLFACRSPRPAKVPPPPRGQSLESYLAGDAGPEAAEVPPATETSAADSVTLHVIDVGQGAAAIVEFPCGAILVDTGGETNDEFNSWDALHEYVDAFFERRRDLHKTFDLMVITHPHIDHTRNIKAVLKRYRVRNVIDNGAREGMLGIEPQNELHQWLKRQGGKVGHRDIFAADIEPPDGMTGPVIDPVGACDRSSIDPEIHALWGGAKKIEVGNNPNNRSVVLRVDFAEASLLLSGDLEQLAIAEMTKKFRDNMAIFDVDIFLVPHHGSRHSTADLFIKAVTPKVAAISAGPYYRDEDWTARRYGHPHKASIEDLLDEKYGVSMRREHPVTAMIGLRGAWKGTPSEFEKRTIKRAIYATSWDGTVRLTEDRDGNIHVDTGM